MNEAPWQQQNWFRDRIREFVWQALSWPYAVAIALTVLFLASVLIPRLNSQSGMVSGIMLAAWGFAWARREAAKLIDAKAAQMQNGKNGAEK